MKTRARRPVVAAATLLVLLAGSVVWWSVRFAPINVSLSDIVSIELDPYPEGPPSAPFQRRLSEPGAKPLSLVEEFVPVPLPAPRWQGLFCRTGGNMLVELADGRTITYGPCRRPPSIDHLWAHMVDVIRGGACRPACGPGGAEIPLHRASV